MVSGSCLSCLETQKRKGNCKGDRRAVQLRRPPVQADAALQRVVSWPSKREEAGVSWTV